MRCTVQGARTSRGPVKQLESSLRSRRKLRLVEPGNEQKPVRLRSPCRQTVQDGRGCRLHITQNWTIAGSRHAPELPGNAHTIPEEDVIASRNLGPEPLGPAAA